MKKSRLDSNAGEDSNSRYVDPLGWSVFSADCSEEEHKAKEKRDLFTKSLFC